MLNHPNRPGRNRVVRRVLRRRIRRPTLVRGLAPACNCNEDAAKTQRRRSEDVSSSADSRTEAGGPACFLHNSRSYSAHHSNDTEASGFRKERRARYSLITHFFCTMMIATNENI